MIWISVLFACSSSASKLGEQYGEVFCEAKAIKEIIIMTDENKEQYLQYSDRLEEETERILQEKEQLNSTQLIEFNAGLTQITGKDLDNLYQANCELGFFTGIQVFGINYDLFVF